MADALYPGATELEGRAIRAIVGLAMDAPAAAKSGHPGTAMALAPLGVTLFSRVMAHHPSSPDWPDRDRFILSCGHASILQYGLAHVFGYDLGIDDLKAFRQLHSRTPGHPENGMSPTVEVTTGPLGQGLANGVGMAMAERLLRAQHGDDLVSHRVWVVAGDGCLEEGISHVAASFAGAQGLDRLTVFYDDNHITIDGPTELALGDNTAGRFRAYGWHVIELGEKANDIEALEAAAREAIAETSKPTLIIIRSHIGFPASAMMDRREAHGSPFSADVISETKGVLGLLDEPFAIDASLPVDLPPSLVAQKAALDAWRGRMDGVPDRAARLTHQLETRGAANIEKVAETFESGSVATRKAMQRATDAYGFQTPGLTTGSADLTDNTGVLLPNAVPQGLTHPEGRQIYYGVREFAMGAIMVGQALHGGVRPVGSTFFVFSDYVRPAIRLAALSHASVLFVFTHDSIGVGEDGPTHQPIEHLAALRAMPRLHVVRPSDANETLRFVEDFLGQSHPPATALVLSRQDVPVLTGDEAAASLRDAHRGGYVVREVASAQLSLIATGSEVSLALSAADMLASNGVPVRVVALPCWRCFEGQPADYRASVLAKGRIPSVAVEAGSPFGWERYADEVIGIDDFGVSAPGSQVFAHFGITAENVARYVSERIAR